MRLFILKLVFSVSHPSPISMSTTLTRRGSAGSLGNKETTRVRRLSSWQMRYMRLEVRKRRRRVEERQTEKLSGTLASGQVLSLGAEAEYFCAVWRRQRSYFLGLAIQKKNTPWPALQAGGVPPKLRSSDFKSVFSLCLG
jgi:hypothetical protein